jgi:GalNAc5-diNAcBac-PP-undecaprenol beta-1,3-glucosyltransferase
MSPDPLERDVLLIVPTHDHATTLGLAVRSALEQSVTDLDVVIVGDGVGDDTRAVARELVSTDDRVRFLDEPKSPSRAEATRHAVITASGARIVTYLGDDDLLLPDHVETMQGLLADHDFAHPFPIVIDDDDRLRALPTDLGDPRCVEWHLHPGHNTVSLTGAAHTMAAYRRLPRGWHTPPPGRWPDHYMWEQFLRVPDLRVVTSRRSTTVKLPASLRHGLDAVTRGATLQAWWDRMHRPGFRAWWDAEVEEAVRRGAIELFMDRVVLSDQLQETQATVTDLRTDVARTVDGLDAATRMVRELEEENAARRSEATLVRAHLEEMQATRTWRLHDRLMRNPLLRRALARHR